MIFRCTFTDNWARVFVVITFLTFGEAQIIGGIVPNVIAFVLFLGAIGHFLQRGKWLRCSTEKTFLVTPVMRKDKVFCSSKCRSSESQRNYVLKNPKLVKEQKRKSYEKMKKIKNKKDKTLS